MSLRHPVPSYSRHMCVAVCCSVLHCVAFCLIVSQCVVAVCCCSVLLQCVVAVCCCKTPSIEKREDMCCALQCVAVCCSVSQCVAVSRCVSHVVSLRCRTPSMGWLRLVGFLKL